MATYREIHGKAIKSLSTDLSAETDAGQIWYNTSGNTFKSIVGAFAFRSTTSLPSGRDYGVGGGATQNASWIAGGEEGSTFINTTFEYNGSGWTASGNMGDARIRLPLGNNGPQTAGLGAGGYSPGIVSGVEEYDGSTWTGGTAMPGALQQAGGAGPQTANIVLGGGNPTTAISYNGSAWASEGSSSEAFAYYGLAGTNSEACLAFYGAEGPPGTNRTTGEEYNGTAWTTVVGTLPNQGNSGGAQGTTTAAIFAGNSTTVRSYDGTSITLEPSMTQPRGNGYIGGTATSGITSGGSAPGSTANCEEFDRSINTFTAAAWASGGNMNTARAYAFGTGTQTAALGAGGYTHPPYAPTVNSEEYNGTSWTEGNNLNTGRYALGGLGTQTAAVAVGGDSRPPGTQYNSNAEEYDGSSWTNVTAYPVVISNVGGAGIQTAGVIFGGSVPPGAGRSVQTTEYDGTNWTTASPQNLNTARSGLGSGGTQTAAIGFGGDLGPGASAATETYNGSTWTSGGSMINSGQRNAGGGGPGTGSTTDCLAAGGPSDSAKVEAYDGTAWSTRPSLAAGRAALCGGGTSSTGIVYGGDPTSPPYTGATEEYTGETSAINVKTLTQS
tara:strand:+ start:926 stop:2758 length:1833 start_codon:yes stop_codon:yes gene_type:complete